MLALTLSARVRIVPVKPFAVLVKLPMFAISSLLLLSAAPIAALMAIGKPKGERAAPFRAGAHAKDGADRLFCFARKLRVGVPTRPVAWGDRGGEKSRAKPLRHRSGRHRRSEEHTSEIQSLMRISYAVFR